MRKTIGTMIATLVVGLVAGPAVAQQSDRQQSERQQTESQQQQTERQQTTRQQTERQQTQRGADVDVRAGQTRVQVDADRQQQAEQRSSGGLAYRASDINGMDVRNAQGEELGTIQDLVIDMQSGRVRYAALGAGGFLGIGEKMFAIPWSAFEVQRQENETYLLLNAQKQAFEDAPGFNEDSWPNFADQKWVAMNEQYYREAGVTREETQESQRTRTERQEQGQRNQLQRSQSERERTQSERERTQSGQSERTQSQSGQSERNQPQSDEKSDN